MSDYMSMLKEAYKRENFVVLDTETTGLHIGEIVQIAIVDRTGATLLDTLVKPTKPIPIDAQAIHGINDEMVNNAPNWELISPKVVSLVQGKDLLVYNAVYDRKMLHLTAEANNMPKIQWRDMAHWICVMEAYAVYHGDWNDYRQSYKWQKLVDAARDLGVTRKNAHSALGDCLMTLGVVNALAQIEKW